jgi:cellulose synthase (UDP-forming)
MNQAKHYSAKSRHNPPLLGLITLVTIVYLLYYLWWRATATLNPQAPVFSWVLWLAEAFGAFNYLLFAWMTHDVSPKVRGRAPKAGIKVDILVPTYNEDPEILEATLTGCNRIAYPHKTYVLDDGKREAIRELAMNLGCCYITRPTNEHAKAGNINFALSMTDGEFIVILDADMIPQPGFIDRALGYFEDRKLALVQMPQEFYNQDSIQHDQKAPDWHEQSLFFRVIQPGKNHTNSAFWCGSPSIVRRAALEDVGGVATETITEDIHTSVRLHSRGWSTLFLNEPLAFGIAPQTIKSFLLQRLRWAQGTMQLYRSSESPLWVHGLSWQQRLSYLSSFLAYFEAFQKLTLLMTPTLIILFNIFPMQVNASTFILHWVPYFALSILANQVGGRGYFRYYKTEKYNILKMMIFIQSTLTLFQRSSLKFKVTPKSVDDSVYTNERKTLRLYMGIFGFITGTILYGFLQVIIKHGTALGLETALIALFWAVYNAMLIFTGVQGVLRKQHERKQYRFPVDLDAEICDSKFSAVVAKVRLTNLSITGAGLISYGKGPVDGSGLLLHFDTPDQKCIYLPIDKIHHKHKDSSGQLRAGLSFARRTGIYRERLFAYLFIDVLADQILDGGVGRRRLPSPDGAPGRGQLPAFIPARVFENAGE